MRSQVVLITGCSSGFGWLTAQLLAERGHMVYAGVRDLEADLVKELKQLGGAQIELVVLDVTKQKEVDAAVQTVLRKSGRLDVLINNAGFGFLGPVEDFTVEEAKEQFEVNVFGVLRMIKAVMPQLRQQRSGTIINLSSVLGKVPFPLYGVYSATKHAVEALTEALYFEAKPFGVQVALVEPGTFMTSFTKNKKVTAQTADSVYAPLLEAFRSTIQRGKEHAKHGALAPLFDPLRVARLLVRLVESERPPLRSSIGVDTFSYFLVRKFFPLEVWFWGLRRMLRWG